LSSEITVGMSAPPMGTIMSTPKTSGMAMISGNRRVWPGSRPGKHRQRHGNRQQREIDDVLSFISDGTLRQQLLQLAGGHQAAGEGQAAQDHFHREHRHHEGGTCGARR
jgi:hypothetical protein